MNDKALSRTLVISLVLCIALACGCTQSATPPKEATDIANATADRVLRSIDDGSYAEFSENFSAPMLQDVNESVFDEFRNNVLGQDGHYRSKTGPETLAVRGDYVFIYTCQFEKGQLQLQLSINATDRSTVDGLYGK